MPYLNLDLDYLTHPKTIRLVGLLGEGSEILPIRLWCYVGKYHPETGRLVGYSAKEVESVAGWKGEAESFIKAMMKVGFLVEIDNGYELHEWKTHEGHLVMFKKRAKRAAFKRWGFSNATSNAKRKPKQCPLPNHTLPNQPNQTKEERLPAKSAAPPTPQAEFVEKFSEAYTSKTGAPFKADREDYVIAAKLLNEYGATRCVEKVNILGVLCEKKSAWFTKDGWASFTIKKLSNQWNSIIPEASQPTKEDEYQELRKKQEAMREQADRLINRR